MNTAWLRTILGVAALAASPSLAAAQDFPSRVIRLIVPYSAGGPVDLVGRVVAERMRNQLNQAVVVENRPGGSTMIGAQAVRNAPPSGYTLLVGTNSVMTNTLVMTDPGYVVEDFVPVAAVGVLPIVFTVTPSLPIKSVADFVSYFKARPGQGNFGTLGGGSGTELLATRFVQLAGLQMVSIPYKGGADATMAVASGQVHMWPSGVAAAIGLIREGKLQPLAVAGEERTALLPDVPTFKEAGFPEMVGSTLIALFARSGIPDAELQVLRRSVGEIVAAEDYRKQIAAMGIDPWNVKVEDLPAAIRQDLALYEKDVQRLGLKKQ